MNKIKVGLVGFLSVVLVIAFGYLSMKTIDEEIQARENASSERCAATKKEAEREIVLESIDSEISGAEVQESYTEVQQSAEEVAELPVETDEHITSEISFVGEENSVVQEPISVVTDYNLVAIAQTVWGECRGGTKTEQAAVVWCILNRVDDARFPNTIIEVVSAPYQFQGYSPYFPVEDDLLSLAEDVLSRWYAEKSGEVDVGRILPKEYCFFEGDGSHNYFTTEYKGADYWNWTLPSPYEW